AGIVFSIAARNHAGATLLQCSDHVERALHLALRPNDADKILHGFLKRVLDLVRTFAIAVPIEWRERVARRSINLTGVHGHVAVGLGEARGVLPRTLAKYNEIRKRIAA